MDQETLPDGSKGAWRAGGIMIQRLPQDATEKVLGSGDEDAWRRAMVLLSSTTGDELLDPDLPARDLLFRLFHEDGVRVWQPKA
ncbi:Hsp33 family molecular chaperone HslO, partial [Burkholderia sp. SIMBA_045]